LRWLNTALVTVADLSGTPEGRWAMRYGFHRTRRRDAFGVLAAALLALSATGCSTTGGTSPAAGGSATGSVPVVTPTTAYAPLVYANQTQRRAFQAFLACATDHGIEYEGPFADSTGHGVYLRLAAGEHASQSERERVGAECPQFNVAMFGTPVGRVHERLFERAATAFVRCVRSHGYPKFPSPEFGGGDPLQAFWRLPLDWSSARFTETVTACVDPLRSYLFGS